MTMQLWIKGTRCLVRADQLVAITVTGQEEPPMHLVWLETTGGQFSLWGFGKDDYDQMWPAVDALVEMVARCDRRNESGVITLSSSGKIVLVEHEKWADYRGEDKPVPRG